MKMRNIALQLAEIDGLIDSFIYFFYYFFLEILTLVKNLIWILQTFKGYTRHFTLFFIKENRYWKP